MPNRAPDLVWDEPAPDDGALTRTTIVRAAIEIADRDGLDAVSIRRVAAKLGARPMSLYTHIASKDDLLDLMLNEVVAEALVPEPLPDAWREALREIARYSYRAFVAHPWTLEAFGRGARVGPNVLRHAEESAAAVAPLALEPEDAWRVLGIVDDYTLGCAVRTATFGQTAVEERFPVVDPGEHPELARMGYPTVMEAPDAFEIGLETVLDGVERRFRVSPSSA